MKGCRGSVLVSQYATKHLYQVFNLIEDTFILKGWDHNPDTKGKLWYFVRDESRYNDKLLHCTVDLDTAQCFAVKNEKRFYDPARMPTAEEHKKVNDIVEVVHVQFQHAEGKLKEHAWVKSTKPLLSTSPGEITVGDIMFIELKNNIKKPLLLHVDVYIKMITGLPLSNKSEEDCTKALLDIKADYQLKGRMMKQLVFDREPGIVPLSDLLSLNGIELILKAAGQKVGLTEVTIRLVREKARATKAGVRVKYGYLPPKHFNMDLCMDSISVLNRIPKRGQSVTPYETFTSKSPDYTRDLRVEWGEPIVIKKPKGISSDLAVTGQWAVIIRRIMNGTGVLKVYLV